MVSLGARPLRWCSCISIRLWTSGVGIRRQSVVAGSGHCGLGQGVGSWLSHVASFYWWVIMRLCFFGLVTDFYLTELFFIIVTGHLGAILSTVFWTIFVAQVSVLRGGGVIPRWCRPS